MINKEKYLVSLDLDGTLLCDDKSITNKTKSFLCKFEKEGNFPILNSGRAPRGVRYFYNKIGLKNSPIIGYNGAYAYIPSLNKTISYKLDKNIIKFIYSSLIDKHIVCAMCENEDTIFVDRENDTLINFFDPKGMSMTHGNLIDVLDIDPYIFLFQIKDPVEENQKVISELFSTIPGYEVRFWNNSNIAEIHLDIVSKSTTLKKIIKICNVSMKNVLVFGDAENDIELFNEFKNSFIMINGVDKFKPLAKYITKKDNNHDGVILEIKNFIKSRSL